MTSKFGFKDKKKVYEKNSIYVIVVDHSRAYVGTDTTGDSG